MTFRLSAADWRAVLAELEDLGDDDRAELEGLCAHFVAARRAGGKALPKPKQNEVAWADVADAAEALQAAINRLDATGLNFEFLTLFQEVDPTTIRQALPRLVVNARAVASIETALGTPGGRADPWRDWLVRCLIDFWTVRGGAYGATAQGPRVRFLAATLGAALEASGSPRPSRAALRTIARRAALRRLRPSQGGQ